MTGHFIIQTDHKSLKYLNKSKDENGRLARWALPLQPLDYDIEHRAGTKNNNADSLSRQEDTTDAAVTNKNFTPKRRGEGYQGRNP